MAVDNGALARRYITELWGKGDVKLIDELIDDKFTLTDPFTPKPIEGKAALKQRIEMMNKEYTEGSVTIHEVAVAGDVVVVRDRWAGVQAKDFFGVAAKGQRMAIDAVDWLRIKNGKVVENISYFDVYTMFRQLGALPPLEQFTSAKPEIAATRATA